MKSQYFQAKFLSRINRLKIRTENTVQQKNCKFTLDFFEKVLKKNRKYKLLRVAELLKIQMNINR